MQTMVAHTHRLEDWDDLRYFLAVAQQGSLSAASRHLDVNQSTVFRRIGQLEERLDARLFDRQARGYALTAVGEEMLTLALRVEDDVLALDRAVSGANHELRGTVRVATVDEVLERVAGHLKNFLDRYPGIDLEVSSEQRIVSLTRREADVAIRPGQDPTEPDVVGRKLVKLPTAAYASPKYLRAHPRPRRVAELASHALIGFPSGHPVDRQLRERLPDARVVYRANSMRGQAIAACVGLGVALLPTFMGDHERALERLFIVPPIVQFHLWLLIHADLRQTARVRAFVDFMAEAIVSEREQYEGRKAPSRPAPKTRAAQR